MTTGIAPSGVGVVCVDFDATLYPWAALHDTPPPLPGAVEAMKRLHDAGFRIVIFTSRLSPTWLETVQQTIEDERDYLASVLIRDGIPFNEITAEKVPAEAYLDDRAYRVFDNNLNEIVDWLLFNRAS